MTRSKVDTLADESNTAGGAKQRIQPKIGTAKHKLEEQNHPQQKPNLTSQKKRSRREVDRKEKSGTKLAEDAAGPTPKRTKREGGGRVAQHEKPSGNKNSKIHDLKSTYGMLPLQDLGLPQPTSPTPENLLTLIFNAMLTSARISHQLAHKSVKCLIEAGYHDVEILYKSTWEDRTKVLTKGGYTHYREKTATALGELAEFVKTKYDGNLNNLLKKADSSPPRVRKLLQEIKGIGNVGTDIFFDTAQGIWPCIAPFIDPRSLKTAEQLGLGNDVNSIWQSLDQDPTEMYKLSSALTEVRLGKKEKDFQ